MWESEYIGQPWAPECDCYEWTKRILKQQRAIEMPVVSGLSRLGRAKRLLRFEQQSTRRVADYQAFDLVLMKYPGASREHHIGVYSAADEGGVIHAMEEQSVIFQPFDGLQAIGWEIQRVVRCIE